MNLSSPIVITPPTITKNDGSVQTFNPITLSELDITIIDNAKRKSVMVRIRSIPRPLVLWTKEDYDNVGDYTQSQVEAKVLELLGDNPVGVLESLFLSPSRT